MRSSRSTLADSTCLCLACSAWAYKLSDFSREKATWECKFEPSYSCLATTGAGARVCLLLNVLLAGWELPGAEWELPGAQWELPSSSRELPSSKKQRE